MARTASSIITRAPFSRSSGAGWARQSPDLDAECFLGADRGNGQRAYQRVRGARLGAKRLRRGRDGVCQCDPSRDHDPGRDRVGLCALRGVPGCCRKQAPNSLRRRTPTACTTARNGSSNTPRPRARAGSAARLAIGLRRSTACKTSFRTARSSIFTLPGTETISARAPARSCRALRAPDPATCPTNGRATGLRRNEAHLVSTVNGGAAFGGTPDDRSVVAAIEDLKARGLEVCLTPFILMDIPAGNTLPDPYSGGAGQAVYPWRGRITKDYGTADKTPQVAAEVACFVAQYRNFVLHYAELCAAAGGVDVFLLGSELRGLTWLRDAEGSYPFVSALVQLAADVKAILPGRAAYLCRGLVGMVRPPAGGRFGRRVLPSRSALGRCQYRRRCLRQLLAAFRLARHGAERRRGAEVRWNADRDHRLRLPDGQRARRRRLRLVLCEPGGPDLTDAHADHRWRYGKPWVFRYKDVWSWWSNQHFNRPGGVEDPSPTSWIPQSKPILVYRARLPLHRQGLEPAERLLRSEIVGKRHSLLLGRHAGLSDPAALPQFDAALFQRRAIRNSPKTAIRKARSMPGAWPISAGS